MKNIIISIAGLLIILGVYGLGIWSGHYNDIRFGVPAIEEKYAESNGRPLFLLVRSEGIYCGKHLITAGKEMEEIDRFVRKHNAGWFYIGGGDDAKYGDFTRLVDQLRERYHFRVTVHLYSIPADKFLPEVYRRWWESSNDE
jgi:hypothetical protein